MKDLVMHCRLCGCEQVVRGASDVKACPFCGAPSNAIAVYDETNPWDRGKVYLDDQRIRFVTKDEAQYE